MIIDLSDYLRSLDLGELSAEDHEAACEQLRSELVREMRRRGLWGAPPRYLGILAERWHGEAIGELVVDCYVEVFLVRLERLKNQLLVKKDVGGLIVRCVQNFVHQRQKDNDRLGYRLYEIVRKSLQRLAATKRLRLHPGGKVHNGTVCLFASVGLPEKIPEVDLGPQVRALNDDLWPQLIMAWGRARTDLNDRLDDHLARLPETGVEAFRFRDLIEPLKRDARRRRSEEVAELAEEMARDDSESERHLRDLRDCMLRRMQEKPPDTREALHKLWSFLYDYALGDNPSPVAEKSEKSGKPPTDLGLAKALGTSRYRIGDLRKALGKMIETCRSAISGKVAVKRSLEAGLRGLPEGSDVMEHYEQLRAATREATARWVAGRSEVEDDPRPPRPGDIFVFPVPGDLLVEWLVVEETEDGLLRVVAVDDSPGVGHRDVVLDPDTDAGLASVRCAADVTLAAAAFDPQRRTGSLTGETLDRVRSKRAALVDSSLVPSLADQEIDEDPQYQNRMEELGEVRAALAKSSPAERAAVLPFQRNDRAESEATTKWPGPGLFALAASVLLAVGFGSVAIWQLQSRITALEEELQEAPHSNLPFVWFTGAERVRGDETDPFVVSTGARRLALILEVTSPKIYPRYRVEIVEGEPPKEIWASDQLIKSGSELSFDLPRSLLRTGGYELRIYGLTAAEEPSPEIEAEVLERYTLWIELE